MFVLVVVVINPVVEMLWEEILADPPGAAAPVEQTVNLQILIHADTRLVLAVGEPLPGNRHDCTAYAESGTAAAAYRAIVITDGGYQGTGRVMPHRRRRGQDRLEDWKEDHNTSHRRVRARIEHVFTRLRRLDPDPVTGPIVRWIFAQRLAGTSVASVARQLNEECVRCPSAVDVMRNLHRSGEGWTLGTVATILGNPRYTGRQVWNRQCTDHGVRERADDVLGRVEAQRWNPLEKWVISVKPAHPALVSEEDFVAAQAVRTAPVPVGGVVHEFQ